MLSVDQHFMKRYLFIVLIFIALLDNLSAGWVIQVRYSNPDGDFTFEVIEIQNNKLRSTGTDGVFVFDLTKNTLAIINELDKTYLLYDISEVRQSYFDATKKFLDQILEGLSDSERGLYQMLFADMENLYAPIDSRIIDTINIKIEAKGETMEFFGFAAEEYLVWVNEKLTERKWLAKSLDISNHMDIRRMREVFMEISPSAGDDMLYQYTDAYLSLAEKGFEMRSLDTEGQETVVVSVAERELDDSVFLIPANYRRITIEEMMMTEFGKAAGELKQD